TYRPGRRGRKPRHQDPGSDRVPTRSFEQLPRDSRTVANGDPSRYSATNTPFRFARFALDLGFVRLASTGSIHGLAGKTTLKKQGVKPHRPWRSGLRGRTRGREGAGNPVPDRSSDDGQEMLDDDGFEVGAGQRPQVILDAFRGPCFAIWAVVAQR